MDTETKGADGAEQTDEQVKNESSDEQATNEAGSTTETTFGKPGEIVQKSVSGMEHSSVSGEERERPRSRVLHANDLEQPKPKPSHRVAESPTSTHPVKVSPPYGAEGHREHGD